MGDKAELREARKFIKALVRVEEGYHPGIEWWGKGWFQCQYCGKKTPDHNYSGKWLHEDDCVQVKARAFLRQAKRV